ncbi:MAG: HAD family hydrolase [Candidatus Yanofskybacteria bacterium]|nr:HAD family hydrolase [Candidatus Yanofskybacteria bacterium]
MKILFCDWNGTLLDDMPVWDNARRKTFLTFGVEPPTIADYFQELENGDYMEVYRKRGITASREELNAIYGPEYERGVSSAALFPGVKATLQLLHQQGVRLALVTAQHENLVVPLLNKFDLCHLFSDCAFHVLDKKTVVAKIVQQNSVRPNECSFVGDAPSDIRHAKKAGVIAIAFLGGHIPKELLAGADHYIRTFEEVTNLL